MAEMFALPPPPTVNLASLALEGPTRPVAFLDAWDSFLLSSFWNYKSSSSVSLSSIYYFSEAVSLHEDNVKFLD